MSDEKITIHWDDLRTRRVDNRLREQDAMERNRSYSQMQEDVLPEGTSTKTSIWNNAIFAMVFFGFIGGCLGWGASALATGPLLPTLAGVLHYQPTAQKDSAALLTSLKNIDLDVATEKYSADQAKIIREELMASGRDNPYFVIANNPTLTSIQKLNKANEQAASDQFAAFLIKVLSYGLCGMMIAMSLAIAEPISQRKTKAAIINGLTGAIIGLLGGIVASLLVDRISDSVSRVAVPSLLRAISASKGQGAWISQITTQVVIWGMLGTFLGMASGMVLVNLKKFLAGSSGGLLGGLIGGVMFVVAHRFIHHQQVGRLIAMIAIGTIAGLATGFLENAIKAGWLKVTSGIIAGKQFILYRNPTYIGSAPDCQIYLFKDAQVGKRHAAIHIMPGGIEIENLPLGVATLINGRPIERAKLHNGDEIRIGATAFRFQEKRPAAGK